MFTDFEKRESSHISTLFLRAIFSFLSLSDTDRDKNFDEFADYQLLNDGDITETVWALAREKRYTGDGGTPTDEVFVRMDVIWAFLSSTTTPDNCNVTFPRHSQVTKLVLVL